MDENCEFSVKLMAVRTLNFRAVEWCLINTVYSLRLIHRSVGKHFVHFVVGEKWSKMDLLGQNVLTQRH